MILGSFPIIECVFLLLCGIAQAIIYTGNIGGNLFMEGNYMLSGINDDKTIDFFNQNNILIEKNRIIAKGSKKEVCLLISMPFNGK